MSTLVDAAQDTNCWGLKLLLNKEIRWEQYRLLYNQKLSCELGHKHYKNSEKEKTWVEIGKRKFNKVGQIGRNENIVFNGAIYSFNNTAT